MRTLPLANGKGFALVDDEDYPALSAEAWYLNGDGYVINKDGRYMHRLILDAPRGLQVDHKNGVRSDNQRHNLRLATPRQNALNRTVSRGAVAYLGVSYKARQGRYYAHIKLNGVNAFLGSYGTAEEAARAYDAASLHYHGAFARTNFPDGQGLSVNEILNNARQGYASSNPYRGVYRVRGRYRAQVRRGKHTVYMSYHATAEEAALAFDEAARRIHGERAKLNFPAGSRPWSFFHRPEKVYFSWKHKRQSKRFLPSNLFTGDAFRWAFSRSAVKSRKGTRF